MPNVHHVCYVHKEAKVIPCGGIKEGVCHKDKCKLAKCFAYEGSHFDNLGKAEARANDLNGQYPRWKYLVRTSEVCYDQADTHKISE